MQKIDTQCVPVLSPFSPFLTLGFSRAFSQYRLIRYSVPFHFVFPFLAFSDFRVFAHFQHFSSFQIFEISGFRPFFTIFVFSIFGIFGFAKFSHFSSFQIFNFLGFRSFFTILGHFRLFQFSSFQISVPVCTFLIFALSDFRRQSLSLFPFP